MIVYFADRYFNILGQASTGLPQGLRVTKDKKIEEIETGINTFECDVHFNKNTRSKVEDYTAVGNYLLRNHNGENELYTIIESEIDTKGQTIYIYAEDAGLDLINEVVGAYEADQAYPISHYINKYASNAGFVVGINEAKDLSRKLSWTGEATATERLASVATQFDGCEISYRYEIEGLHVVKRYIDIYKERGKDAGITLFLNKDIDSIVTTKSIYNLATALQCTGGTPENEENPITLKGYTYDDGDFYVDDSVVKSRKALERWNRFLWKTDETQQKGGHITRQYSYDTLNQSTLCKRAITELKKIYDTEVNYEIDIKKLPDNVKIGDRINIVDDAGEMYVSTRVLKLQSSVSKQEYIATLGEHLIKTSGIHEKVAELAAKFASMAQSAARALVISNNAKSAAQAAQEQANTALDGVENAQSIANEAKEQANTAFRSANEAQTAASNAQQAVNSVEKSVGTLTNVVNNANQAAQNAQKASEEAQQKANQAASSVQTALKEVATAKTASENAEKKSNTAIEQAEKAQSTASTAKTAAEAAQATAEAAKIDAENAQKDVDALGENLDTVVETMTTDYTRKTELTETTANLQAQITKNAAEIGSTVSKVVVIDETANDAQKQLQGAREWANTAQKQADKAQTDALDAQNEANIAQQAAINAQNEADTAKQAADAAKQVVERAKADLKAAQDDLKTVLSRADATEEEITAAQQAVDTAQTVANAAKADAEIAVQQAVNAQTIATVAAADANYAQLVANNAASQATLAQKLADDAKGNAKAAQQAADEAATIAAEAQRTANDAITNANTAQTTANAAVQAAAMAQQRVDETNVIVEQATAALAAAQQNLEEVTSRVDATEKELQDAQTAVSKAQTAVVQANTDAATAQAVADIANNEAIAAQTAAIEAQTAVDNAIAAAIEAQTAADIAQGVVDGLAVRSTTAETKIIQNALGIKLAATREDVSEMLGGYYTKEQTEAIIQILSDSISTLVTDGNGASLMTQNGNRWTFSIATMQSAVETAAEKLATLTENLGSTDTVVEALQQAVNDVGAKTDYINISTYTYDNENGDTVTEPCIELGENENDYKVLITNTQILFKVGSAAPTRIDVDGLITENITVDNDFRQRNVEVDGYRVWAVRANGNYGLQWKEG